MAECHNAAWRQGTLRAARQLGVLVGSFANDPALLKAAAETVMLEAQRMEAAEQRFAERRNPRLNHAPRVVTAPQNS